MRNSNGLLILVTFLCAACGDDAATVAIDESTTISSDDTDTLSAAQSAIMINVGGKDTVAPDGSLYVSDQDLSSGGVTGKFASVRATPHATLYETFRSGDFQLEVPLTAGAYDVTFHFAEPNDTDNGVRVFDVLAEGKTRLTGLDIYSVRSEQPRTALARTIANVDVADAALTISFNAHEGTPILSGLTIRPHVALDTSNYELAWSDEFDIDGAPDPARWNIEIWDARKVNNEAQAYTDNSRNVRIEDGALVIEAHQESHRSAKYTSARVTSKNKGDFLYGRVETRAKLPLGGGTWPAIWIYPTDQFRYSENCGEPGNESWVAGCAAWPNSGEIDIMEHVGNSPGVVHSSIHTKAYYWVNGENRKGTVQVEKLDEEFHVFAINWTPDRLDTYVDDVLFFSYQRERDADWQSWPFDHPYHVILNLAMGGAWGGKNGGIDDAAMPQRLTIDYVRVYELSD